MMNHQSGERRAGPELGGYRLTRSCHVCAFFATPDEEYDVLMPFISDGFDAGAKAFHTIDPARIDDHTRRLADADITRLGFTVVGTVFVVGADFAQRAFCARDIFRRASAETPPLVGALFPFRLPRADSATSTCLS